MTEHDRNCVAALSQLFPELSQAEQKVAILNCVLGMTTQDIAIERGVGVKTIETNFKRAKEKLECNSLQELRSVVVLRIMARNLMLNQMPLT
ncbi:sigma-70 region 4 domain-containing protein [Providencia alcalifaciens]|uniref:helix-turn-helix transcriptional regulator n=1 Tax=Providencia alcalifaciens TaxID=126385 RepID=UPI002B05CAB2|nr:sigma-70 region 4 domain-containing protein [Providencia alcalifaciens]